MRHPLPRFLSLALLVTFFSPASARAETEILTNASYDVTREFYQEISPAFAAQWKARTGNDVEIRQSHGGSSKQARAVIDGLEADVVSMNQALDIDQIAKAGLIAPDWAKRLPNDSVPFRSTIVLLVRSGNPKGIRDWNDIVKPGVAVILPNPKTSGNGRYSYLAAWAYGIRHGGPTAAKTLVTALFANVPVLDTGGRAATTTFAQRDIGDVLLTFENEVALIKTEFGPDKFEVVYPSLSIRADLPVAWVDKVVAKRGTREVAEAYLQFLYTPEAQEIGAKRSYRPTSAAVAEKYKANFPSLELVTVEQVADGWDKANATHFADGGIFDQIYGVR